jgi:hypothetical protein
MHTTHSDGTGTFEDVIDAASSAGLDFVYVTDHNILVRHKEEGYRRGILTMVGQEVHDEDRVPPGNHLLCLGVEHDVSGYAKHPQSVIEAVRSQKGLSFLAHPIEEYTEYLPQHFSWASWEVTGYTGVELWNYMSGFRGYATSKARALAIGFLPNWHMVGPVPAMLKKWDGLTQKRRVVAIGGTDVHAWSYQIGLIRRCFLPYAYCAQALNTHILVDTPLAGTLDDVPMTDDRVRRDHGLVLGSLKAGHCWVGYDLVGPTRGFRFSAWQVDEFEVPDVHSEPHAIMGDALEKPSVGRSTFFRAAVPRRAEMRLLRNGIVVARRFGQHLEYASSDPGVFRVEVWRRRWGKPRGWIFSNPIYVR